MSNTTYEDIINAIRPHIEDIGDASRVLMRRLLSFKATLRLVENIGAHDAKEFQELSIAIDAFAALLKKMDSLRGLVEEKTLS